MKPDLLRPSLKQLAGVPIMKFSRSSTQQGQGYLRQDRDDVHSASVGGVSSDKSVALTRRDLIIADFA